MGNITTISCPLFLLLGQNALSGRLPPEYGFNPNLESMDLGDNRLSGGIPNSTLSLLNLGFNNPSGPLPTHLPDSVLYFNISGN